MGNKLCCEETRTEPNLLDNETKVNLKKPVEIPLPDKPYNHDTQPHHEQPQRVPEPQPRQHHPHKHEIQVKDQPQHTSNLQPEHRLLQPEHKQEHKHQSHINQPAPEPENIYLPEDTRREPEERREPEHRPEPEPEIKIPVLTQQVQQVIHRKKFSQHQDTSHHASRVKTFGGDVYVGSLSSDGHRPDGFGKMYKQDGSLYMGEFLRGKAEGKGVFIFPDGSYYDGEFHNNQAERQGEYISPNFRYMGGFKQNKFEGEGVEIGEDYSYEGEFHQGLRTKGTLKWNNDACVYQGTFNENKQFHGKGTLKEPEGTFNGYFENGEKEGKGEYNYAKGSRYQGNYHHGRRQGYGTLYQKGGQIYFQGEFRNGLPHGKGSTIKEGKLVQTTFVEGIQSSLLQK